jgi:hypothetical protein
MNVPSDTTPSVHPRAREGTVREFMSFLHC